jgi:hypothetical protein
LYRKVIVLFIAILIVLAMAATSAFAQGGFSFRACIAPEFKADQERPQQPPFCGDIIVVE